MAADKDKAEKAHADAGRFRRWAWFWRLNVPVVCGAYWLMSSAASSEKLILVYLAAVSIIALVDTNDSKAEAAEARAAGYEE